MRRQASHAGASGAPPHPTRQSQRLARDVYLGRDVDRVGASNTVIAEMAKADVGRGLRRFKRVEYERLAECGFFHPTERLELIDGLMLVREPQGTPHATAITLGLDALRAVFGAGWVIRIQLPIALDEDSEPEPDLVIVRGRARDFSRAHPASVALVVEVADSSLAFDRGTRPASTPAPAWPTTGSST